MSKFFSSREQQLHGPRGDPWASRARVRDPEDPPRPHRQQEGPGGRPGADHGQLLQAQDEDGVAALPVPVIIFQERD